MRARQNMRDSGEGGGRIWKGREGRNELEEEQNRVGVWHRHWGVPG